MDVVNNGTTNGLPLKDESSEEYVNKEVYDDTLSQMVREDKYINE